MQGAPSFLRELSRLNIKYAGLAPKGVLEGLLGKPFKEKDWFAHELNQCEDEEDKRNVDLLRAYPVKCLLGSKIRIRSADDVSAQLSVLLNTKIPGYTWNAKADWSLPLKKYSIIHGSVLAPRDEVTGEPMSLEIYGRAIRKRYDGSMTIRIRVATYSNIQSPRIGVPFYL